ncbi:MAG: TolC family outer membrane protein [Methylococcaceae bacterium]|nr:TolC family outer membrane protein [Methylococcaceae bacterium]
MTHKSAYLILLLTVGIKVASAEDLQTLYQQALQFDPNIKSAQLQVEMSEAQRSQVGGMLLPQISANVNISGNNQNIDNHNPSLPGNPVTSNASLYNGQRYNVALTQSIIDLPKVWNWKRYQNIVAQYQSTNEEAAQTLIHNVIERYFQALEARDTLSLIESEIASTQKQVTQMQRQFEKQLVQITDVYELEAKLDLLVADQIAAKTQLDIALQGLTELTGQPTKNLAELRTDISFKELKGSIDEWVTQAEALNPGLSAQNKAIEAADDNLWAQQSRHLPTVDMQLNYYHTNTGQPGYQNQTSEVDTEMAAVNINIPIFSGGTTSAAAVEASKNLEINKQKRIAILRTLIKDTRDSFLSTNASVKRISATEKALQTSTKARQAMDKGFQYGMQTISDVLVSEDREFKAKREILQAKYAYIKNRARFERATGLINEQFLQTVNQWLTLAKS